MKTLDYLLGPDAGIFWPAVLTGLVVAIVGALLSPLVVLRRMAFIGQGVSHAAFAGVGLAVALLWLARGGLPALPTIDALTTITCVAAGLGIAWLSARDPTRADTAIGIVLVGAMALGFVLLRALSPSLPARTGEPAPSVEQVLFGSLLFADWFTLAWTAALGAAILGVAWWLRRPMLFWAFDPPAAEAFGVRVHLMRTVLIALLALAIVLAMRVAGVVLASAVLVAPGAAALALSARLARVLALSTGLGALGVLAGFVLSFELDLPPGPGIGLALVAVFAVARAIGRN